MKITLELVLWIIDMIFVPADCFFSFLFFYCTSFLRTLTVSVIFVLTLGKIFSVLNTKFFKVLKWTLYIWFFIYSLYSLGIFTNLLDLSPLDWSTFLFSVLAPISMIIVGKQIAGFEYKQHKIFVYFVIMILYALFVVLWFTFYPNSVNSTWAFIYWGVAFGIVLYFHYFKTKGGR